jgi:hypothetical protein
MGPPALVSVGAPTTRRTPDGEPARCLPFDRLRDLELVCRKAKRGEGEEDTLSPGMRLLW